MQDPATRLASLAAFGIVATSLVTVGSIAQADTFTLRIASEHPPGVVYAGLMKDYFEPELKARVEARTEHRINFIEGYSGSIVKVAADFEEGTGSNNKERYAGDVETLAELITVKELDPEVRTNWALSLKDWPKERVAELEPRGLPAILVLETALESWVSGSSDEDDGISIMEIFRSSTPYWFIMLIGMIAIVNFPQIATYLPNLVF